MPTLARQNGVHQIVRYVFWCLFNGRSISIWYVCLHFEDVCAVRFRMPESSNQPPASEWKKHEKFAWKNDERMSNESIVCVWKHTEDNRPTVAEVCSYAHQAHFSLVPRHVCASFAIVINNDNNLFINMRHIIDLVESGASEWSVCAMRVSIISVQCLFVFLSSQKNGRIQTEERRGRRRVGRVHRNDPQCVSLSIVRPPAWHANRMSIDRFGSGVATCFFAACSRR